MTFRFSVRWRVLAKTLLVVGAAAFGLLNIASYWNRATESDVGTSDPPCERLSLAIVYRKSLPTQTTSAHYRDGWHLTIRVGAGRRVCLSGSSGQMAIGFLWPTSERRGLVSSPRRIGLFGWWAAEREASVLSDLFMPIRRPGEVQFQRADFYRLDFTIWLPMVACGVYPAASFLLGPFRRWQRRMKGHCLKCGYDLRGNESGRCPECGRATAAGSS